MKPRLSPRHRLHQTSVPLIGLTGGIASGKSTVANLLRDTGANVISADTLIKHIYAEEETKSFIRQNFPQCINGENIDFPLLRRKAFKDDRVRGLLENFFHPRLPKFFKKEFQRFSSPTLVIYDVPLLFEKSLQDQFDLVVCVYCTPKQQEERLLSRDDIDETLAWAILKSQMDIDIKKELADTIIDNSGSLEQLSALVADFVKRYL